MNPGICAQLNIFIEVKNTFPCDNIIEDGTIDEIDSAIRQGTINPDAIDGIGNRLWLWVRAQSSGELSSAILRVIMD